MGSNEGVKFVNTSREIKRAMENLSKKALRRSGKVVTELLRDRVPVRSSSFKNHIKTSVNISRDGYPQMKAGFLSWQKVKKNGKTPSHASPYWVELGTVSHTIKAKNAKALGPGGIYGRSVQHPGTGATHVLRNTVYDNIEKIKAAQAEHLAQLSEMTDAAITAMEDEPDDEDD